MEAPCKPAFAEGLPSLSYVLCENEMKWKMKLPTRGGKNFDRDVI